MCEDASPRARAARRVPRRRDLRGDRGVRPDDSEASEVGPMTVGAVAAGVVAVAGRRQSAPLSTGASRTPLEQVRQATAGYQDVTAAIDAGYVQFFGCVHEPLAGSMGIHFVNGALAGDAVDRSGNPGGADVRTSGQTESSSCSVSSTSCSRRRGTPRTQRHPELFGHAVQRRRGAQPLRASRRSTSSTPGPGRRTRPAPTRIGIRPSICSFTEGHTH